MRDPSELIGAYFDDCLGEGEWAQLQAWLAEDPERLRQFARESIIHSRLRDVLVQHDVRGLVFDEAALEEADGEVVGGINPEHVASLLDEDEAAAARRAQLAEPGRDGASAAPRDEVLDRKTLRIEEPRSSQLLVYISVAAAAALLIMIGRMLAPGPQQKLAAPRAPVEPPPVARVAHTFDAELLQGGRQVRAGGMLPTGPLALRRGVAELELTSGAKLIIEGPAELELLTADRAKVLSGRVVAQVPQHALGFTLHSKSAAFVDLGTEFGVEVSAEGLASVHVLDGEVALVSERKGTIPSRTLQRGLASEVGADGAFRDIAFDESRFLRRVPASAYELAVLKSRPLAYWRLNELSPGATFASEGRLAASTLVNAGVTATDNRAQRGAGGGPNRAAFFSGDHDGIETGGDELLGRVSDCTCEAWVLPGEAPSGPRRIFSTFDRPRSGLAMGMVDTGWYQLPGNELRLQLTVYGNYDCLSTAAIPPGRWVHVAATIDAAGTPALYVDGEAQERLYRVIPPADESGQRAPDQWSSELVTAVGRATGGLARIGRNPVGADGQITPERWRGLISNVAYYDRALPAEEIAAHFAATRITLTDDQGEGGEP